MHTLTYFREVTAVQEFEKVVAYAAIDHGKTKCICMGEVCHHTGKPCGNTCKKTVYLRNRFDGWRGTMKKDRFGK